MSTMRSMIGRLAGQYRWAAQIEPPPVPGASAALVCGMGGSGISGDFAAAAEPACFIGVHKSYVLPEWAERVQPLVVAVSYSGNTEETCSAAEEALALGLQVAVVAGGGRLADLAAAHDLPLLLVPSGLQPRAALGYLTGAVLRCLESAGLVGSQVDALTEAGAVIDELAGSGDEGAADALAGDLADALAGRIPLVYGAEGLTRPVAQRWKTQINENSKRPAFWSMLPELDHNEIAGWKAFEQLSRRTLGIILLRDEDDHPQIQRRFAVTAELIPVPVVGEVYSTGTSRLARMAGLAYVGDLTSVHLAEHEGVDAVEVEVIERLKVLLR